MNVAVLAPGAAAALASERGGVIGGAERQLAMLGAALTEAGHQVDYILEDDGGAAWSCPSGRAWPIYPLGGIPLLKLLHPKGSRLLRFLREQGSDIVIQRGASELTALAAGVSRLLGLPFCFSLASDSDLLVGREILPHPQDRVLFRVGLGASSLIITQTAEQTRQLRRTHGLIARQLPSFGLGLAGEGEASSERNTVLWGGNLRPVKRPELLIELAKSLPDISFTVFGGATRGHERYAATIVAEMRGIPNIDYLGPLAPSDLPALFRRARIFVNSSTYEGFPNTFLEAWAGGSILVSSVDPDALLSRGQLGIHASSLPGMRNAVSRLMIDESNEYAQIAERARRHVETEYAPQVVAERWIEALAAHTSQWKSSRR